MWSRWSSIYKDWSNWRPNSIYSFRCHQIQNFSSIHVPPHRHLRCFPNLWLRPKFLFVSNERQYLISCSIFVKISINAVFHYSQGQLNTPVEVFVSASEKLCDTFDVRGYFSSTNQLGCQKFEVEWFHIITFLTLPWLQYLCDRYKFPLVRSIGWVNNCAWSFGLDLTGLSVLWSKILVELILLNLNGRYNINAKIAPKLNTHRTSLCIVDVGNAEFRFFTLDII